MSAVSQVHSHGALSRGSLALLIVGAVGVVYGDIGTSPLYAFREALEAASHGASLTKEDVFGLVSLILWSLIFIVTIKYVSILLRADNAGEGGTLSLMALMKKAYGHAPWVTSCGIIAAALFYGDCIITPAISVLSAVEGLKLVTPSLTPYILPFTFFIILILFSGQRYGTGGISVLFGPIMVVWFLTLAVLGLLAVARAPEIFHAINPYYGLVFLVTHGFVAFPVLGSVFLAITGAEALYADLGHFGRWPIQWTWNVFVFPALALNYLGQGALVLIDPEARHNPFFFLVSQDMRMPLVILATIATVIASQAVITGAYSLTQQAVQLGLLPRFQIQHTSKDKLGQIYLPRINKLLCVGVLILVAIFRSSSSLANAYGVAVTGTMLVTSFMAFFVIWRVWGWSLTKTLALIVPFSLIELVFLGSNLMKIFDGALIPLFFGFLLFVVMSTWVEGTRILTEKASRDKTNVPLIDLIKTLENKSLHRVQGTAVFLTGTPDTAPPALLHNLKHNKILHEKNIVLTIHTANIPYVPLSQRVAIHPIDTPLNFMKVDMSFGYMETPNVPKGLAILRKEGVKFDIITTSFFLSRRSIRASPTANMPLWRDHLFIMLARNASDATDFFQIPTGLVVEVGAQVTL
jgi:KUP system potassium uptake protein